MQEETVGSEQKIDVPENVSQDGEVTANELCGVCSCDNEGLPPRSEDAESTAAANENLIELGEQECAVLLVHFKDTEPRNYTPADMEKFLFGDNPGIGNVEESLSDYFEEVSYGQMSLSSGPEGVAGWYELDITESEYENSDDPSGLIWNEAVKKAQENGFDFSAYDNPFLMTYRAGGDGPAWGGPGYVFQGVDFIGNIDCWSQNQIENQQLSVSAHETGHAIGLPHQYNDGINDLALMSGPGTFSSPPVHLCALEKNNVGPDPWINNDGRNSWAETSSVWLDADESFTQPLIVPPAERIDENYSIKDGARGDGSRYLIEYRPGRDADRGLDNPGVAVYYFPESSNFNYPLGGDTITPDGQTVDTATADIRHPDAKRELVLENVTSDYNCVLCNDPPERSAPNPGSSAHAIPIDLDGLPDGTRISESGETQIDARVAWAEDANDISLELIDPDGSTHAESGNKDANFAVVRSDVIGSDNPQEGGWKLRESVSGESSAGYAQAINHPSYELAEIATVENAVLTGSTLEVRVTLAYGTQKSYEHEPFGLPEPSQFDLDVAGKSISTEQMSVTDHRDEGVYILEVTSVTASNGQELSLSFTDEKAGVTNTTNTSKGPIEIENPLSVAAEDTTVREDGTADIQIDATAVTDIEITDLWTDWELTNVSAGGASVDNQITSAGSCSLGWNSQQSSVSPSVAVSLPERYVGGEYKLLVTANGNGDTVSSEISLTVS